MKRTIVSMMAAAALVAAGCGGDGDSGGEPEPQGSSVEASEESGSQSGGSGSKADRKQEPKPKPKGIAIKTGDSQFGAVVFDEDDRAIYMFDKETSDTSECYGECAVEWPPVLTEGKPRAAGEISQGRLGTTKRDDGTTQVTYNGHPLYYYDEPPGVVSCHNVPGFGGLWLALDPSGDPIG